MMQWHNSNDEQPEDGMECLTVMKHGMISGVYDAQENEFRGYYWHDLIWTAKWWVPLSEVQPKETP